MCIRDRRSTLAFRLIGWGITFLAVVIAWIFFRASNVDAALQILRVLPGLADSGFFQGEILPLLWNQGLDPWRGFFWLGSLLALVLLMPNSNQIGEYRLQLYRRHSLLPAMALGAALVIGTLLVITNGARDAVSAFIYFNF